MVSPVLSLAFPLREDAEKAVRQHLCLCRNEDVLLPSAEIEPMTEIEFNALTGIELLFENTAESFIVGFNRFSDAEPMYGRLVIVAGDQQ